MKTKRELRIARLERQGDAVFFFAEPFPSSVLDLPSLSRPLITDHPWSFFHG
jgi:hypothetical protein